MVRALNNGDWTFGHSKNNYISGDNEIGQNVVTRLRSFKFDWFLDFDANVDWLKILGEPNNQAKVESDIRRVTLNTKGVTKINSLELLIVDRVATIIMTITTIFGTELEQEVTI